MRTKLLLTALLTLTIINITAQTSAAVSQYVGVPFYLDGPAYQGVLDKCAWSTDDGDYISISKSGDGATIVITNYFTGTKEVSCYYAYHYYTGSNKNNVITHFDVEISCIPMTTTLSAKELTLGINDEVELSYFNSKGIKVQPVWSSADKNIATVDDNSWSDNQSVKVKGISEGETVIIFRPRTENQSVECKVTVKDKPLTKLSLSPAKLTIIEGKVGYFKVETTPADAHPSLEWKSSSPSVATVNKAGVITGVTEGTSIITATSKNGISASATVEVLPLPKSITMDSELSVPLGYTITPEIKFYPEGSSTTYTFKSSDTTIARVNSNGCIEGIKEGECTITCTTSNKLTASAKLKVVAAPESLDMRNMQLRINEINNLTQQTLKSSKK